MSITRRRKGKHEQSGGADGRFVFSNETGGDRQTAWRGSESGDEWRRADGIDDGRAKACDCGSQLAQPAVTGH